MESLTSGFLHQVFCHVGAARKAISGGIKAIEILDQGPAHLVLRTLRRPRLERQ